MISKTQLTNSCQQYKIPKLTYFVVSTLLFSTISLFTPNTLNDLVYIMTFLTIISVYKLLVSSTFRRALTTKTTYSFLVWLIVFFLFIILHYYIFPKYHNSFSLIKTFRILAPIIIFVIWTASIPSNLLLQFVGKCSVIITVPIIIVLLNSIGLSELLIGSRFGDADVINGNVIASNMMVLFFFSLFIAINNKQWRLFTIIILLLISLLIMITGCRRGIFGIIVMFLGMLYIYGEKHKFKILCIVTIFSVIMLYLMFNVQVLFDVAGIRILKTFSDFGLYSNNSLNLTDNSADLRTGFVPTAISYFIQNPILGNGMNYFIATNPFNNQLQSYNTHSNYLELLVSYGIVGFIIYFSFIFKTFIKVFRRRNYNNVFKVVLLFFIIDFLIIETTTTVFYTYTIFYIIFYVLSRVTSINTSYFNNEKLL